MLNNQIQAIRNGVRVKNVQNLTHAQTAALNSGAELFDTLATIMTEGKIPEEQMLLVQYHLGAAQAVFNNVVISGWNGGKGGQY